MNHLTHLHVHSWYSMLEWASSPETLLKRAAACGYTHLALTDTNNLYGAIAFVQEAVRHGVRPLLGACLRQNRSRCVALIGEGTGYRSLCRIISGLNLPQQNDWFGRGGGFGPGGPGGFDGSDGALIAGSGGPGGGPGGRRRRAGP